jgi:hypothetical protein
VTATPESANTRERELRTARRIAWIVSGVYYLAAFVVFRQVLFAIPDVLAGRELIVGDELVPYFNPHSQLLDQAAGEFNELTNGYEFRVRYSFLTTWLRHYQVLPFAILLVIPAIFVVTYRTVAWFIADAFRMLSPVTVYVSTAFPVGLLYMIVTYAKITHFYTLIVGLAMMTISVLYMMHALLFSREHWLRRAVIACVVTLLNPAVHYLVLFTVFLGVAGVVLIVGEVVFWIREGGAKRARGYPRRLMASVRRRWTLRRVRGILHRWGQTTLGRGAVAAAVFVTVTLIPYYLFVTLVALRGVENLSETVPGDYYFIRDASVSWLHMLSWDLAGIMDKVLYGDYLSKVPRVSNLVYSAVFFAPLLVPAIRRSLRPTRAHRQFFGVVYIVSVFAMWATIGYAEPAWFPTFHRTMSSITRTLYATDTPIGDLALSISASVVQVLRFPHRFQLILYVVAPVTMSLTVAWAVDALRWRWRPRRPEAEGSPRRKSKDAVLMRVAATGLIATVFFVPFLSNDNYRQVYGSGNFGTFLAPYPVGDLSSLKDAMSELPDGKTIVLPPTETAKLVVDDNGIDHKFIDKFFVYYLDKPSFYYGLTGDSYNKYQFFLILRGIYYQQDWWVTPARDIGVRYVIVNKKIGDNGGIGAEYLPDVESYVGPAMERQVDMGLATRHYENDSYVLYEIQDEADSERETLLIDSSWTEYLNLVWNRLDLSACYDLDYLPYFETQEPGEPLPLVYSPTPTTTAIDLWGVEHRESFFRPSSQIFPFNSDIVAASYYLSPMFREYLFLSNTKWNRTEVISPGVFGTFDGSFIAVPRATEFTVPVKFATDGKYRVLMRGAAAGNSMTVEASTVGLSERLEFLNSPDSMQFYTEETIYTSERVPVDVTTLPVAEIEAEVDAGLIPVNTRYEYHDLGVVDAAAGAATLTFTKHDSNPLLVEGVLLIPEHEYQTLSIEDRAQLVQDPDELECSRTYDVFGIDSDGYIDPAANEAHEDLSNEELLSLAASGVPSLEPDDTGGLGADALVLAIAAAIVLGLALMVRARTHADVAPDREVASTEDLLQPKKGRGESRESK